MTDDFHSLFERFIEESKYLKNLSPKTIISYNQAWAVYRRWLGTASNEPELKRATKDAVMGLVREAKIKSTSINIYGRAINSYLGWLHREGHTAGRIVVTRVKELQGVIPTFTDGQVEKIVHYKPSLMAIKRVHVIACVILDIGARIQETLHLRKQDIDFDSMLIKITGKGNKERVVPFTMNLRRILWRYMEDRAAPAGDLVFWQAHGRPLSERNVLDDFYTLCDNLGIRAAKNSFHPLRHTMATNYIRNGGDAVRLQRILGHASITTTMKYVHLQTEDLQRVHDRFSALSQCSR